MMSLPEVDIPTTPDEAPIPKDDMAASRWSQARQKSLERVLQIKSAARASLTIA